MLHYLGLPTAASTHAGEIDQMIGLVHWLMLVLFIGWGLYFIYVLFRFRRSANPVASYTGAKGKISKGTEVAVAIIEVLLLVFYAIPAWARRVQAFPAESEAVVVRVVGEQFAWNVHYPGPDGKFGRTDIALVGSDNPLGLDRRDPAAKDDITTINQLNLPVDRPVLVHEAGRDPRPDDAGVVHPEPGRRIRDRLLTAVRTGPLPDAWVHHRPECGRLPEVVLGPAEGTDGDTVAETRSRK
jgi:cytochrome c oxidase subunit 2